MATNTRVGEIRAGVLRRAAREVEDLIRDAMPSIKSRDHGVCNCHLCEAAICAQDLAWHLRRAADGDQSERSTPS